MRTTKSSTKSNSRKVALGGLAFYPSKAVVDRFKARGIRVIPGLTKWFELKSPSGCVIYDHAALLADYGIPILDASYLNGMYIRTRLSYTLKDLTAPRPEVPVGDAFVFDEGADGQTHTKHAVVMVDPAATAAASGHGKMSRGVGHRSKKHKEDKNAVED